MVSNLVHPSIMKALASQRMSTLLNKKDVNSLLDIGEVNKNHLIRDSLMGVLHEQFEYEFEGIMSPKMKMKKENKPKRYTKPSPVPSSIRSRQNLKMLLECEDKVVTSG